MITSLVPFYFVLLSYKINLIPGRNVTYYFLSYIGGPVARAAGMLRDEWDQVRLII